MILGWTALMLLAAPAPVSPAANDQEISTPSEASAPRRTAKVGFWGAMAAGAQAEQRAAEADFVGAVALKQTECGYLHDHIPGNPAEIECRQRLAWYQIEAGRSADAEALLVGILDPRDGSTRPDDPATTDAMMMLAGILQDRGAFAESELWLQRALEILGASAPGSRSHATCLANLAMLRREQGRFEDAIRLLRRSVSILEVSPRSVDLPLSTMLNNLATVYLDLGEMDRAESLATRVLTMRQDLLPPDHPDVAVASLNLGMIRMARGDYAEGLTLLERSLSRLEEALGPKHPSTIAALAALGSALMFTGSYERAEAALRRAVALTDSSLRPGDLAVARYLVDLAAVLALEGRYEDALATSQRASSLVEQVLGPEHPSMALFLNVEASSYFLLGRAAEAEPLLVRALAVAERSGAAGQPSLTFSLRNLAIVAWERGRIDDALALHRRALEIEQTSISGMFAVAESSVRLDLARSLIAGINLALSQHLRGAPSNRAAAELALTTLLRRKGLVEELAALSQARIRRSLPAEHRDLLADLARVRSDLAAATRRQQLEPSPDDRQVAELQAEQDRLWARIREHSSVERGLSRSVSIADVREGLPEDGALIELLWYLPVHDDEGDYILVPGEPRYGAYLVFPDGFDWVDLGPAHRIDDAAAQLREAIQAGSEVRGHAAYEVLFEPIARRLDGVRTLFIAPDMAFNLVPFAALHDGDHYLVERYRLRYVGTGRDLVADDRPTVDAHTVVAVANPSGAGLPGTQREAEVLRELFPGQVEILTGKHATEEELRGHARPWILHLATHGRLEPVPSVAGRGVLAWMNAGRPSVGGAYNPMFRSWLELAPVPSSSASMDGASDSRLTAYEISDLDLRGTELVVLSACDTGLGHVVAGEGVLGLRRAFAIAGAQTQVVSLWAVGDDQTASLMEAYYRKLLAGEGRAEAMQQIQLELLGAGRQPKDWASFVVVGRWGPLLGVPPRAETDGAAARGCRASIAGGPDRDDRLLVVLFPLALIASRRRARGARRRPTAAPKVIRDR